MEEYDVVKRLPNDKQKVLCFGHRTYCCKEDMEKAAAWHVAIFSVIISSFKIRQRPETDIEASLICDAKLLDKWEIEGEDEELRERVIGVTKWKSL